MTKNLAIQLLSQQITNLLNQSDLEAGIIVLILKNLTMQAELALNEQVNKDYLNYLQEQQNNNKDNHSDEIVTKKITVPLEFKNDGQE